MARTKKEKEVSKLESTFLSARTLVINNPKTVLLDNQINLKIKNIVTDFPEYELSQVKILNAIVLKWFEDNREELIDNHIIKASQRY